MVSLNDIEVKNGFPMVKSGASYDDWESTNPAYLTDGGLEINERVFRRVLLQKALNESPKE